uniref:Uncharacterized protein n=1 Tax=Setaria digitata TaxID=48799 RepID=A0A915PI90_9BILA
MNTHVQQLKEEYEKRLRVSERLLHGEKERRRQLGFQCKQLEAQLKRAQRDSESLEKQLKMMKKCASCSHLDQRSRSYNALNELLRGSVAVLEPDFIASAGASTRNNELAVVKNANSNLQQCVDRLQSMLAEKGRQILAAEKFYNEAISEREQQISQLQKELEQQRRGTSVQPVERTELLNRISRLEKENQRNHVIANSESRSVGHSSAAVPTFETDVNPYCEYCRNREESWNKMIMEKDMDLTGFSNNKPSDVNSSMHKVAALEKKIKKLAITLEMEEERNKIVEAALRDENDNLSSNYQKLLRQYESLEVELSKRRNAEQNAENKTDQNNSTASEVNVRLVCELKNELEKTNKRMVYLEEELTVAKRTIYRNEQSNTSRLGQIEILEKEKRELAHITGEQAEQLVLLKDQLKAVNKEKEILQRKYTELECTSSLAMQEKLKEIEVIETLRKELSRLKEDHSAKIKTYDAQIDAYHELVKQKDNERGALIAELCTIGRLETTLHDPVNEIEKTYAAADEKRQLLKDLRELNDEKQAMLRKVTNLESELQLMKDQLRLKTEEVEKEVLLKNSMHDDLAKARTMLLEKEAQIIDLNNELKVAEVKVMKLETELANSTDRLQVEQITGSKLKMTVEELEDLLQEKSADLITAAQERQRYTSEMQKMKELKYDLETKL